MGAEIEVCMGPSAYLCSYVADGKSATLANQNLRTDLRWVAKRIRKSAHKFTEVANFDAYTVDLR